LSGDREIRGELGARGEQRGQMVDLLDFVLADNPIQQRRVEDAALYLDDALRYFRGQRLQIQCQDVVLIIPKGLSAISGFCIGFCFSETLDERLTNFTGSTGDHTDFRTHKASLIAILILPC
jgi:hypothetical protein